MQDNPVQRKFRYVLVGQFLCAVLCYVVVWCGAIAAEEERLTVLQAVKANARLVSDNT